MFEDVGESGFCLHSRRESGTVAPRAYLAVAADRYVDDVRVELADLLIAQTEAGKRTGPEVFHNDVSVATQISNDLTRLRIVEVDTDVAFTCILLRVVHRHVVDVGYAGATSVTRGRL